MEGTIKLKNFNNKMVKIRDIEFANNMNFKLIAGPCVIENREHALEMCERLIKITKPLGVDLIYKSSFDKANRTSIESERGVGIKDAIRIFEELKSKFNVPIITDVHESYQCELISSVVDIIQIPAFLCRQTDLLFAAANTNKCVMIKKGQFLAPWDMKNVTNKLVKSGCKKILLCERGVSFGYNTLVSDMRSISIMKESGWPVIFDATHSVQHPGGIGISSGGERKYVPVLARAAIAVGVSGLFLETHNDPENAPSDGPNMINIENLKPLLEKIIKIDKIIKTD